jgi:hypothetical protein
VGSLQHDDLLLLGSNGPGENNLKFCDIFEKNAYVRKKLVVLFQEKCSLLVPNFLIGLVQYAAHIEADERAHKHQEDASPPWHASSLSKKQSACERIKEEFAWTLFRESADFAGFPALALSIHELADDVASIDPPIIAPKLHHHGT